MTAGAPLAQPLASLPRPDIVSEFVGLAVRSGGPQIKAPKLPAAETGSTKAASHP